MASTAKEKDDRVNKMTEALKPPPGKFRSMHIEAADNGYTVHTQRDLPPEKGKSKGAADNGGMPAPQLAEGNNGNTNTVFSDADALVDHVAKHTGAKGY